MAEDKTQDKPTERRIFAPKPYGETQPYWDGATSGRLMLRRCPACNRAHHYPRDICPHCQNAQTEWFEASGKGTIYTFSQMLVGPVPYVIAFVTLEEGPTMMTNIVDSDGTSLAIGQAVQLAFRPAEGGQAIPMFAPA